MKKGLFAKKSISALLKEASESKHGFKRTLSAFNLTMMGIGAIIGAGIFVFVGQGAAEYAGPAVALSFVFAAIICVFVALCYAEFASLIPISGSAYVYAYVTMGEFIAWIIGWALTLEYLFACAAVAVGWSGYFVSFLGDLGLNFPKMFADAPMVYDPATGWQATGSLFNVPAMFIFACVGILISLGIKAASRVNDLLVYVKMGVIFLFIVCGIAFIQSDNWVPFIPANTGVFGQYGISGILRGAGVVFFAFLGFDAVSTLAQEARNPQRDMPRGMLASLGVSTIVYVIMALVLTGLVSYHMLGVSDPIAVAVNALGSNFIWLRYITKIGIIASLTTVILVMLNGQARILCNIAQDGLLPPAFAKISAKFGTPLFTTIVITLFGMVVSGLFPVVILGQLVTMGTLMIFAIVCFGVLVLRYKQPLLHRPFKTPFVPWVPLFGTAVCIFQMVMLPSVTWFQLLAWMLIGCWIYYLYGQKHSKVRSKVK